jgi:hypothetical protein
VRKSLFSEVKSIFTKIVLLIGLLGDRPLAAQESAHESSLLWKITGNGLQQPWRG